MIDHFHGKMPHRIDVINKVEGPVGSPLNQPWRLVPAYNEVKEAKIKNLEHYVTGAWRYP